MNKVKFVSAAMAAVLTFSAGASFIPQNTSAITANAATASVEFKAAKILGNAHIKGNGVRHRKTPVNGTILGLMYNNDAIYVAANLPNGWSYVYRYETGQWGYTATQYIKK